MLSHINGHDSSSIHVAAGIMVWVAHVIVIIASSA